MSVAKFPFKSLDISPEAEVSEQNAEYNSEKVEDDLQEDAGHNEIVEEAETEQTWVKLSEEEFQEYKDKAYEEGKIAAEKHRKSEEEQLDNSIELLTNNLQSQLNAIKQEYSNLYNDLSKECAELALTIAEKIIDKCSDKCSVDAIKKFLDQNIFNSYLGSPINITVHPKLTKPLQAWLKSYKEYEINLMTDESLMLQDCQVSWEHGNIERDTETLMKNIEHIVEEYI